MILGNILSTSDLSMNYKKTAKFFYPWLKKKETKKVNRFKKVLFKQELPITRFDNQLSLIIGITE